MAGCLKNVAKRKKRAFTLFEVLVAFFLSTFLLGSFFWSIRLYTQVEKSLLFSEGEEERERLFSYLLPLYSQMIEHKSAKEKALRSYFQEEHLLVIAWSSDWRADRDPLFMGRVDCLLEYDLKMRTLGLKIVGQAIKDQPAPVRRLYFREGVEDFKVHFHRFSGRISKEKSLHLLWEDQWPSSRKEDPDLITIQFYLHQEPVELFFILPAFEKEPILIKGSLKQNSGTYTAL